MGMHGPSSPRLTRYRLSLYRCGCKRLPEFLPRETIANIIEIPPNGYRGPGDANMPGCSDRCNSIEESTLEKKRRKKKKKFRFVQLETPRNRKYNFFYSLLITHVLSSLHF